MRREYIVIKYWNLEVKNQVYIMHLVRDLLSLTLEGERDKKPRSWERLRRQEIEQNQGSPRYGAGGGGRW